MHGGYWGEEKKVMADFFILDMHEITWYDVFLVQVGQEGRVVTPEKK